MIFVSELFYSVQGEGSLMGVPSVFIRTSGCNLRCRWCDTPYTSWDPEGRHMAMDDILDYVRQRSTGHTVVTGGEPMIAQEIVQLTRGLRQLEQHITIETAGTVYDSVECDLMSISPKLANSTPDDPAWRDRHDKLRYQPHVLRRLMSEYPYQLKFVVAGEGDIAEVAKVVSDLGAEPARVILMPEGVNEAVLRERSVWLTEACKERGWRFSPRLHILLYGNKRGT